MLFLQKKERMVSQGALNTKDAYNIKL